MRTLKTLRYCFVALVCFGLTACSTTNHQKLGAGNSYGEDGIESAGIGSERSFDSDSGKGNSLKAPYHQIYYFSFDNSAVHDSDRASIEVQAKYLATHPRAKVRLEGNTDNRGSREYNIALGEHRAASVADILKLNGASASQIKIVSYGAQKPVAFGDTEEDYQLNRRVELFYERK
jgi:peptidoglycan-associated lipoprotein